MDFDDDAQLDTSQVTDRRGGGSGYSGSQGGGVGPGTVVAAAGISRLAGGGVVGLIAAVAFLVVMTSCQNGSSPASTPQAGASTGALSAQELKASCRTGADADTKVECRAVATINSVQAYWAGALSGRF